jgi:hypothetical protein
VIRLPANAISATATAGAKSVIQAAVVISL